MERKGEVKKKQGLQTSVSEESSIDGDMGPVVTKSGSSDSPIVISEKEVTSTGKQAKDMQVRKNIESKMFDKDAQDDENSLDQFFEEANKEAFLKRKGFSVVGAYE